MLCEIQIPCSSNEYGCLLSTSRSYLRAGFKELSVSQDITHAPEFTLDSNQLGYFPTILALGGFADPSGSEKNLNFGVLKGIETLSDQAALLAGTDKLATLSQSMLCLKP